MARGPRRHDSPRLLFLFRSLALQKSYACPSAIFLDEVYPGGLESSAYGSFIRECNGDFSVNDLCPSDRCDADFGSAG